MVELTKIITPKTKAGEFIHSSLVKIIVGPDDEDQRTFWVHEGLITARSAFFKKALNGDWAEADTKTVNLPEEDPYGVALYLQLLYTGTLAVLDEEADIDKCHYLEMAKTYIVAEMLLDPTSKNLIMHGFLSGVRRKNKDGDNDYPVDPIITIIYEGTASAADPARRLLVNWHARFAQSDWITDFQDSLPKDFLYELSVALLTAKKAENGPPDVSDIDMYLAKDVQDDKDTKQEHMDTKADTSTETTAGG
ncbi:hypothetical protein BDV95DRAFT_114957 [Massariosphaeria phaeospora]|uniref:BTB domain-containing protein n=1 Tax=Massariosphaeria phaeospora TaxID=100035 RepID=A0A7C8IAG9_9PLEO|nr:hypothetical protein BDV95DRAFT_114957 [Massariosphaeria phaeospora]